MAIIIAIAHMTLLEAVRNRLAWLAAIVMLFALGLGLFLNQVAVTESLEIRITLVAAFLRVAAAFIVVAFAISSVVREANDKVTDLLLSLPTPRSSYFFGKLAGFALVSVAIAAILALPLLAFVQVTVLWPWAVSLAFEMLILASMSLFCALSLGQTVSAFAAVAAFYALSRSIAAMQIIASTGVQTEHTVVDNIIEAGVDGIGLLLPALDRMTLSGWLIDSPVSGVPFFLILGEALLYVALIGAASLFDLYRKSL
ncbi:MAG: ABC transporter permease [Betaproteobacteria bacterium]|nr:ABC transporter permease [Betaproteobacteria bacterium]